LNEYFSYNPETGKLTWKKLRPQSRARVGDEVGCADGHGYRRTKLFGRSYEVHRICWILYTGFWPKSCIDHINHIRDDNRICNLREVSYGQNQLNRKHPRPSRSGHPGIHQTKAGNFAVFALGSRQKKYLGTRSTIEIALQLQQGG
jgi:hypothetical protein